MGLDMRAGRVVIGPVADGEYIWAGRPIVCDWWK